MSSEIRSVGKSSPAMMARERLFSGVRSDVALEQPRSRKRFSAQMALARKGVGANVHFQSTQRRVHFRAIFATERLFREIAFGGCAVELSMFRESGICGVRFSTVGALIARSRWVSPASRDRLYDGYSRIDAHRRR